jgi:hypothetical protein
MTFPEFRRLLSNIALALCVLFVALFAGDSLVLRYRFAAHGVSSVTARVTTFDAALMKDSKYSVFGDQPQTETCVRSIFPWLGLDPCWYVRRHDVKILN